MSIHYHSMRSLFYLWEAFLYQIDFFKSPFYFTLNSGRTKISSKWGSFYSIIIIGIIFALFINSPMISKENPSITAQNILQSIRKAIPLKNSEFRLFIGIYDRLFRQYEIDESMLSLKISFSTILSNSDNDLKIIRDYPKIVRCPDEYHREFAYCLEDFNFSLRGYLNNNSTGISIALFLCNNKTRNNTCKNLEYIKDFLAGKYFTISYNDHAVDFNNYEEPIQSFSQKDYFVLDVNTYKTTTIYFKKVEIFDDDDIYFYNKKLKGSTYMKDYAISDFSQGVLRDYSNAFAEFQFFASENIYEIKRSYQKLGQVLAFLSGIYNLLKILGFVIINFRVHYMIQNQIMNFLYDLDFTHLKQKFKTFIPESNSKERARKKMVPLVNQKLSRFCLRMKKEFNKIISFFFNKDYHEEYLNIVSLRTILNSLHDLQKLKIILLDSKQLKLFENMKRPKISVSTKFLNKDIADPGFKLFDLIRTSYKSECIKQQVAMNFKNDVANIPNTVNDKLNFFNKDPL